MQINTCDLNTRKTGDLTVHKTVAGDAGDLEREFRFTVTLNPATPGTVTYGRMTFVDGTASFTLKHDESLTASGVPTGTTYTVTEVDANADDYKTTVDGNQTGTIVDGTLTVNYTNTKATPASLVVTKTVTGDLADPNKEFHFEVDLHDPTINDDFEVEVADGAGKTTSVAHFTGGKSTLTLKHGQSATVKGLPEGARYTVNEVEANPDGYKVNNATQNGTIPAAESGLFARADYVNDKSSATLNVTKTVRADEDDTEALGATFHFTVRTFNPAVPDGTYGQMTFSNGVATFTLGDGQTMTATGLPADVNYSVTEAEAGQDGYETTVSNGSGTIPSGGTATAAFTNNRTDEEVVGSLTVTKILRGGPESTLTRMYTFTVTGPNGYSQTVTTTGGGSVVLDGLEPGTYNVAEADAGLDGYTWTQEVIGATTVEADENSTAYVINVYEPEGTTTPTPGNNETINDDGTPLGTQTYRPTTSTTVTQTTPSSPQVEEVIDDLAVPLASTPKTGDERNLGLWIGLGAAALVGAGVCGWRFVAGGRRRKSEEE